MDTRLDVDLTGKVALVTGATGGIGREIARGLARMGATVVVGCRDLERGAATCAEINAKVAGDRASALRVDVADQDSIRAFVTAFEARSAELHVLVNNAGAWFTDRIESPDGVIGARAALIDLSARLFAVSPAKGADTPLWVSVAPELDGVTGRYFTERQEKDGKFREPGPIADLERQCSELEQASLDAAAPPSGDAPPESEEPPA